MRWQQFIIKGKLAGLNEYTSACRANAYEGAGMKNRQERICMMYMKNLKKVENYPVELEIKWYEKDRRRDIDNITFAVKFIQDALVKKGILEDDSRKYVAGLSHTVLTDKENPRIEVNILER